MIKVSIEPIESTLDDYKTAYTCVIGDVAFVFDTVEINSIDMLIFYKRGDFICGVTCDAMRGAMREIERLEITINREQVAV